MRRSSSPGRIVGPALLIATALSACTPLSVAGLALDILMPQPSSGEVFRNPMDHRPDERFQEALAGLDRKVTPQCRSLLERINGKPSSPADLEPAPETKACRVRLVCVGGAQEPTSVLVCPAPDPAGDDPAGDEPVVATAAEQRAEPAWRW